MFRLTLLVIPLAWNTSSNTLSHKRYHQHLRMHVTKTYSIRAPRHDIEGDIDFRIGPICRCTEYRLTGRNEWGC